MSDLLDRLQNATEGSRQLSDHVLLELGWTFKQWEQRRKKVPYDWITPDGQGVVEYGKQPDPSRNLQDAVSLRPAAEGLSIKIRPDSADAILGGRPLVCASTAPLAVCIGIIKAHESKAEAA